MFLLTSPFSFPTNLGFGNSCLVPRISITFLLRKSGEEEISYFAEKIIFQVELSRIILRIRRMIPMADDEDDYSI
jgi:hypothetical protein